MNKVAAYITVLTHSDLWDPQSLEKIAVSQKELDEAKSKAQLAAGLHGVAHIGVPLTSFVAGYQQRSALRKAGIDYEEGGDGTFGAKHPIISGFIPVAGTVSALNAAERISAKKPTRK
jgi:hypothetical protein